MPQGKNSALFFFDFPLKDVFSEACSGLKLIYYGSEAGFFGSQKTQPVDLKNTAALRIKISHRSVNPLSDAYDYSIVYYRNDISKLIWSSKHRGNLPTLKEISRRVECTDKPSLKPKLINFTPLQRERPIYIAEYNSTIPDDNYVPRSYVDQLHENFQGFIMRSKRDQTPVVQLFETLGLNISNRREVKHPSPKSPDVVVFSID